MAYEHIIVETRDRVGLVTLNRPKALNALNSALIAELNAALEAFEADAGIGCIVIAGSEKAFAAGADVKEMADKTYVDAYLGQFLAGWARLAAAHKPVIAAVSGFCLGGGCELAMMCDFIIASAKAMDMILTGRMMEADEAERCGLVARVVAPERVLEEALAAAATIASYSQPIVMMAKETVNRAQEMSQEEGIRFERRLFLSMFATEDQKEGMAAFIEKRKPGFRNR